MQISTDPSLRLAQAPAPSILNEAAEGPEKAADGDADDAKIASKAALKPYQGTKVDLTT